MTPPAPAADAAHDPPVAAALRVPAGLQAVTPYLVVPRAAPVVAFLQRVCGAREVHRVVDDAGRVVHVQLQVGDARVMMGEATADFPARPACVYVYVPDVDAAWRAAVDAGASTEHAPDDRPYGDRVADVTDPAGNRWILATHRAPDGPALPAHRSRAVRAAVVLHERELRRFVETWGGARAVGLTLPATQDPSYASLEELLRHVLRAARGYMTWTCEQLGLPDPGLEPTPEAAELPGKLDAYLEHVCARWRVALADVADDALEHPTYMSRWKVPYCIDAMLEHAVMHPLRHAFQLEGLLAAR